MENSISQQGTLNFSAANDNSILDILMYFDLSAYNTPNQVYTVKNALKYIRNDINESIRNYTDQSLPKYLSIIEAYSKQHPEILDYKITNVSTKDPRYSGIRGLNAAAFSKIDKGGSRMITLAFRGTASGEWYDNGQGLGGIEVGVDKESLQQKEAARYFEDAFKELKINRKVNLTVTGHSKGGNKIQYIMMMSLYADAINTGYSFGGQGFSPEAIAHFKEKLGTKYNERIYKLYSIAADNDYVNVLGYNIIPIENTYYFKANCTWLYQNHYPHVIFQKDGSFKSLKKSPHEPGFWGQVVKNASDKIMCLPAIERNKITIGMMTIAQRVLGRGAPINKEKMNNLLMFTSAVKSLRYLGSAVFETLVQLGKK